VFNINEPILFGLPVIMNPIMLIPFNLVPLVLVTVQYAAMKIGAVAVTTGVFIPGRCRRSSAALSSPDI
jgi:PTS system cellobiose-specific IIC component